MAVVSVNKPRGGENVAWRAWACSPKLHSGKHEGFMNSALKFFLDNQLLAIGYADDPLATFPATWGKFEAATGYPPLVFHFARRMKKGDLVVLGRNCDEIVAYGYLKDSELRYIDGKHPLARKLAGLHRQSRRIYASIGEDGLYESFRNYRLVEEWIPFNARPKNKAARIDGNYRTTVAAVEMQKGLHWLGLADEPAPRPKVESPKKQQGRKKKADAWAGPHLGHLTEELVKKALVHYELHLREQHPTETPEQAPFVIRFDGKLYQPWPMLLLATSEEFRRKFRYSPPDSPLCGRLRAIGFPVVRHPKAQASSS